MRTIKFRGQRVSDKRWVYGCLVNNLFIKRETKEPCCYIIPEEPSSFKDPIGESYYYDCWEDVSSWIDDFEVIPETVGQYTEVKDKNGEDIYENDVVTVSYGKGKVIVSSGCFMIEWIEDKEAMMELLAFEPNNYKYGRPRADLQIIKS